MPRRSRVSRRVLEPDARYGSKTVSKFINCVMKGGKKSIAEGIFYDAMDQIEKQTRRPSMDTFDLAMRNATPTLEVKTAPSRWFNLSGPGRDSRRSSGEPLAMRWPQSGRHRARSVGTFYGGKVGGGVA